MQQPPGGYGPPPSGYGPPPGYQQGYGPQGYPPPQPPPRPTGWEGSKTIVAVICGCLGLFLIVVIGPWIGCAACLACGSKMGPPHEERPAAPAPPRKPARR